MPKLLDSLLDQILIITLYPRALDFAFKSLHGAGLGGEEVASTAAACLVTAVLAGLLVDIHRRVLSLPFILALESLSFEHINDTVYGTESARTPATCGAMHDHGSAFRRRGLAIMGTSNRAVDSVALLYQT